MPEPAATPRPLAPRRRRPSPEAVAAGVAAGRRVGPAYLPVAILLTILVLLPGLGTGVGAEEEAPLRYPLVDTAQALAYDDRVPIEDPKPGEPFFGQDAQYEGNAPATRVVGEGPGRVVEDRVTGLTWTARPLDGVTFEEARRAATRVRAGGHRDWRLPTIKELYSLIRFDGQDPDPRAADAGSLRPFLDAAVFDFRYGDPAKGERVIDAQYVSATRYVHETMRGDETVFGVNFADGRIKGYPLRAPHGRGGKTFFALFVRGNADYGKNDFHDPGDGTIVDRATGLVWMKVDSGHLRAGPDGDGRMTWKDALAWAETLDHAGHDDWRVPNAKELQSIVDYGRSPDTTASAAIDPLFETSTITNEVGRPDFPFYWTSTTHASPRGGESAVYVAFGRSLGFLPDRRTGATTLLDVHGAGSQRSDPKTGDAGAFPRGRGPQGDVIRIRNHVRCVRGGAARLRAKGPPLPERTRRTRGGPTAPSGSAWVRRLDRDGDGTLDADEAPRGPPPGPPPR